MKSDFCTLKSLKTGSDSRRLNSRSFQDFKLSIATEKQCQTIGQTGQIHLSLALRNIFQAFREKVTTLTAETEDTTFFQGRSRTGRFWRP